MLSSGNVTKLIREETFSLSKQGLYTTISMHALLSILCSSLLGFQRMSRFFREIRSALLPSPHGPKMPVRLCPNVPESRSPTKKTGQQRNIQTKKNKLIEPFNRATLNSKQALQRIKRGSQSIISFSNFDNYGR